MSPLTLHIAEDGAATDIPLRAAVTDDLHEVIEETLGWLGSHFSINALAAVGHRVVHGGDRFAGPEAVTDENLAAMEALVPLAPLHQPQSMRLIRAIRRLRPGLPQIASFDTAFHRTQSDLVRRFRHTRALFEEGVKRYGFHGLSYKFIAAQLARVAPETARGRIVAAHLGSGASLCGLAAGVSRDTSMGFSTLDGVPMATRCGALDPGVLIHLLKERRLSIGALEDMLYHRSGLLGLSGISADSRDLIESAAPEAHEALDLFTFRIAARRRRWLTPSAASTKSSSLRESASTSRKYENRSAGNSRGWALRSMRRRMRSMQPGSKVRPAQSPCSSFRPTKNRSSLKRPAPLFLRERRFDEGNRGSRRQTRPRHRNRQ